MPRYPISKRGLATALLALVALTPVSAHAADGQIVITQAKANAGNVTPGDAPGFPVKLSQPGSYIFASNLQPPAGKLGIQIASNDVTIDMNGFRLNGAAGATTDIYGAAFESATIRNGTITGFVAHGIYGTGSIWIVENMRIWRNGGNGISAGELLQVRNSALYLNNKNGVVAGNQSTVESSLIVGSGINGIVCAGHCLIAENVISLNGILENGVGVSAHYGTVLGNTISQSSGFGISGFLAGYGNNTLVSNNGGGANPQVNSAAVELHPNACQTACQ